MFTWILVIIVVFAIYNYERLPYMFEKTKKELPEILKTKETKNEDNEEEKNKKKKTRSKKEN